MRRPLGKDLRTTRSLSLRPCETTTVAVSHTCLISLTKGPVVTFTVGFASLLHVKVCCVAGRNMYAPLACPDTWSPCMIMTGKESDQ